ncbi:MAG: hypothetical protein HYZ28_20345 [Myxococcales bacterium]|nr:hypothetical protein [Myxococcales bacterium]
MRGGSARSRWFGALAGLIVMATPGFSMAAEPCLERCATRFTDCSKTCRDNPCFNRCSDRLTSCQGQCGPPKVKPQRRECYDTKGRKIPCNREPVPPLKQQ